MFNQYQASPPMENFKKVGEKNVAVLLVLRDTETGTASGLASVLQL